MGMAKSCVKCGEPVYESCLCKNHFRDYFEKKVKRTIKKFNLFSVKDRLGVAASGGKDSTVCLYVLKKLGYNVEALTVDANIGRYTETNLDNLRKVCKKYGLKLHEISFREELGMSLCSIKTVANEKKLNYSSCLICGVLRRYLLNKQARILGLDCLITGHNLDDEAQAFLMNVFRNDLILAKRQGPITGSGKSNLFVKRAKPLYLCTEKETSAYSKLMKFPVNYEACPCRENAYRKTYADLLDKVEKDHPSVKHNIISFFLRTVHLMKDKEQSGKANSCQYCGEPCSKTVCKKCEILISLKSP